MSDNVLLFELSERVSKTGRPYMSGFLGKARVVAFRGEEPDKFGNPVWRIFVAEPDPNYAPKSKPNGQSKRQSSNENAVQAQAPAAYVDLDDEIPF